MHRSPALMNIIHRQMVATQKSQTKMADKIISSSFDVFINHRRIDTKRSVASLLYNQLSWLRIRSFLDNKTMKPGDKLFEKIDSAIKGCKIGVAVFSPRYCDSYFCLHELALMMESKKKVIPIFCNVKPSELRVLDSECCSQSELARFNSALEVARYTVGLTFDSTKGNWSDVVTSAADIVIESLIEMEDAERMCRQISTSAATIMN